MILVGCDFHFRHQQVACVDTDTGDLVEHGLNMRMGSPSVLQFPATTSGCRS